MIVNDRGRKLDDLDTEMLHVQTVGWISRELGIAPDKFGYSVLGGDGTPLVGCVPDDKSLPIYEITSPKWVTAHANVA